MSDDNDEEQENLEFFHFKGDCVCEECDRHDDIDVSDGEDKWIVSKKTVRQEFKGSAPGMIYIYFMFTFL